MLKIRLMRIGTKKRPFYRVVALDERSKRTGSYIENLGTYNPLTEPKEIKLNQPRIDYWVKQGAQPSDGYLRMIGKAPQRPPRKPKKEAKKQEGAPAAAETPSATETTPAAEITTEAGFTSEKQKAVDAPAGETQSTETDKSESVQDKK